MPTNDERREVAARLRDYSTRNFDESSPWLYMSKALTGSFTAYDDASDLFTDLADLIEPEERTCKPVVAEDGANEGCRVCSECGRLYWSTPFCAYCGARVEEDE